MLAGLSGCAGNFTPQQRMQMMQLGSQMMQGGTYEQQTYVPSTGSTATPMIYNNGGACPVGFHPWVDKWGNSICKGV